MVEFILDVATLISRDIMKEDVVWNGFIWLRIGSNGGLL
jgi:hypothetical protein